MKNEKCFLPHLKSFFCSQGFYVSIMTFWLYRKNDLIRKVRLIFQYIIIIFKRFSIAINFLKPESAPSRSCHRGAEVQSISQKKLCAIRKASKLRKDSFTVICKLEVVKFMIRGHTFTTSTKNGQFCDSP